MPQVVYDSDFVGIAGGGLVVASPSGAGNGEGQEPDTGDARGETDRRRRLAALIAAIGAGYHG